MMTPDNVNLWIDVVAKGIALLMLSTIGFAMIGGVIYSIYVVWKDQV